MKQFALSAALTSFLFASCAFAGEMPDNVPTNTSTCKTDDQCVVVEGICGGWTSVNTSFAEAYPQFLERTRQLARCPMMMTKIKPKPKAAFCKNSKCTLG